MSSEDLGTLLLSIAGTLFKETAITLSFAIVVSSFVALTLSPMLGSKFLNKKMKKNMVFLSLSHQEKKKNKSLSFF